MIPATMSSRFRTGIPGGYTWNGTGLMLAGFFLLFSSAQLFAEGTRQLEPPGAPASSFCRIGLMNDTSQNRIPFAGVGCPEPYRLNVFIRDFTTEKIYFGFGDFCNYSNDSLIYNDVRFQIKDPSGIPVPGFSLQALPSIPGNPGYISSRNEALNGPDINLSNPSGYLPLCITPTRNGNYIIEFDNPEVGASSSRVLKYFDVTVARGTLPLNGRLWSQAWQLSSGSVSTKDYGSFANFFIYSDDSIVTRFNCNGLAGGIWAIYSNQWGCSTSGPWTDRRHSVIGNATVQPQYKIFLNDPDSLAFPSAKVGELLSFNMQAIDCDTAITFTANVNKSGNIEILIDAPPYNPAGVGPEDVQLVYDVSSGFNTLLPPWNGKDGFGNPLANGTVIQAQIKFLNGLSNIPLFDVEDNPNGFKVDIQRPMPASGNTRLRIFWDDSPLPPQYNPTVNTADGCTWSGIPPVTGCHEWSTDNGVGNMNTVNSWWYYTTNSSLTLPVTLKLKPSAGHINGPANICSGQLATFNTRKIGMAQKYYWELNGPGTHAEAVKIYPDTTFTILFSSFMAQGNYSLSLHGENDACGKGDTAWFTTVLHEVYAPPVSGPAVVCSDKDIQYEIPGSFRSINWSSGHAEIIGSSSSNPIHVRWNFPCQDTLKALAETEFCGSIPTSIPVLVHPSARAGMNAEPAFTACPRMNIRFNDNSALQSGRILSRSWNWGDGSELSGNDSTPEHSYENEGRFNVSLTLTTNYGCVSTAVEPVAVIPYPMADFTWYRNCESQKVQFYDHSSGIDLQHWGWDFGSAAHDADTTAKQYPLASFDATGTFPVQLIISNKYGCNDTLVQELMIHPLPLAGFSHDTPCLGDAVYFSDRSTAADTVITLYNWQVTGEGLPVSTFYGNPLNIRFPDTGSYTVLLIATDAFGCSDSISEAITPLIPPVSSFSIETGSIPGLLHFINSSSGAENYLWDFGNGQVSSLAEPELTLTTEGNYLIRLVSSNSEGCTDTAMVNYFFEPGLWFPNAFTPNNDGKNDLFRPVTERVTIEPYSLQIFDNWGGLVFESSSPSAGWDGTFNGRPCKSGVYMYILRFGQMENGSEKPVVLRGQVSLIR